MTRRGWLIGALAVAILAIVGAFAWNGITGPDGRLDQQESNAVNEEIAPSTPERSGADNPQLSYQPDQIVIQLRPGATESDAQYFLQQTSCLQDQGYSLSGGGTDTPILSATIAEGYSAEQAIDELSRNPSVVYAQKNYVYHLMDGAEGSVGDGADDGEATLAGAVYPNDPDRSQQWYLDAIGAYDAWSVATGDNRVTVAVIDSGIDMNHPDLVSNIVGPYDAVGDGRTDQTISVPDYSPDDELGHGTHVAGIACGVTDNEVGVSGVSYNANVMPIKVFYYSALSAGYVADTSDIAAAFNYLLGDAGDGSGQTIAQKYNVRVINMSLGSVWSDDGTSGDDLLFLDLIERADQAGILVVCAAGNDDAPLPYKSFPSDYETCVSVIALSDATSRAYFSNYGPEKDISAPGSRILSTVPSSYSSTGYAYMNGTSMASPVVAGAAALLYAANPSLTADQAKQVLYSTAKDLGAPGKDSDYGYGALDLATAVAVAQGVSNTPVSSISGFPTEGKVGEPLALYATVRPAEANQKVIFTVKDAGVTGAALTNGQVIATHEGTATFCATVVGGSADGSNYVQEFSVSFAGSDRGVWNGTADVSWYNPRETSFNLSTPEQLAGLAAIVNGTAADVAGNAIARDTFQGKTVRLTADLYLNAASVDKRTEGMRQWVPIGDINGQGVEATEVFFDGAFDGQGHVLYNIYLDGMKSDDTYGGYQGLFGALGQHAVVANVGLDGGWIFGRVVGGIAAASHVESAGQVPQITGCFNGATIYGYGSSSRGAGGIFGGENQAGGHEGSSASAYRGACRISNCYNRGTIYGYVGGPAGGIAGIGSVEVASCYNAGTVVSQGAYVGSIVGTLLMVGSDAVPAEAYNFVPQGRVSNSVGLAGSCANLYRYLDDVYTSVDDAGLVTTNLLSSEDLQASASTLGSAFEENPSGFPLLYWQVGATMVDLSSAVVEAVPDQLYTGLPIVPAVTVKLADASEGEIVLNQGSDYVVTCEDNVDVGIARLTVSGVGRYTGSVQISFRVVKVNLDQCVVSAPAAQWYTGGTVGVDVTVAAPGGVVLRSGRDYQVAVEIPSEGASATVTVTGACAGVEGTYVTTVQLVLVPSELEGEGTSESPYLISTKGDLQFLANALNSGSAEYACAFYRLTNDINASCTSDSAVTVDPLGVGENGFGGSFDGDGHTITLGLDSLKVSKGTGFSSDFNSLALFPTVRDRGSGRAVRIENLVLEGEVRSSGNAAGFIGAAIAPEIELVSCVNRAVVTCGSDMSGAGFIAYTGSRTHLSMSDCTNQGNISGGYYMAGLVAELAGSGCSRFTGCFNQSNVTTTGHAGGLVSSFEPSLGNSFSMDQCGNEGTVTSVGTGGACSVGGLLGFVQPASDPGFARCAITSCYNVGDVTSKYAVGGLVGRLYYLSVDFGGVYNTGTVTCTNSNRGDVAARPGGLVGMVAYEGSWTFSSAYNAGELRSSAGLASGGLVGWAFYGTTVTFDHAFYNSDESAVPVMYGVVLKPLPVVQGEAKGVSPAGMKASGSEGFASELGEAFVDDQEVNDGFPVLYWQTDSAKRMLGDGDVVIEAPDVQRYTGLPVTPSVKICQDGYTLIAGADYTLAYENNVARGAEAVITIVGIGRFAGSLTCTFEIGKGDIALCSVEAIPDQFLVQGGSCPALTVLNEGGNKLVLDEDFKVTYSNNTSLTDAAQAIVTGIGDYEGEQTVTFAIVDQKWIQSKHVSAIAARQYTGAPIEPQVRVVVDGEQLVLGGDYEVTYADNTNVGQATVNVVGKGKYFGAVAVNFAIKAADLSAARIEPIPQQTYTGQAIEPAIELWYNGALVPEEGYIATYSNNVAVGMASVTVTGIGNYCGTRSASFLIAPESEEPEPEPEPVSISVYVQEGDDADTKQLVRSFDAEQLGEMASDSEASYLYSSDGTAKVLWTGELVTIDTLLAACDVALGSDDVLQVSDSLLMSYSATGAELAANDSFYPGFTRAESSLAEPVLAPAGLALSWSTAIVDDSASDAARAASLQQQTRSARFVVGLSEQNYQNGSMAGSRFVRDVTTVTVVKAEEPTGYPWKGRGTEARPFLITSAEDLQALSRAVYDPTLYNGESFAGVHFKVANDIVPEGGVRLTPIGYSATYPFGGIFDGDGHTIALNITEGSSNGTGLFGFVSGTESTPAEIRNVVVEGSVSSNKSYTAAVCGQAKGFVTIERCVNKATVTSSRGYAAGILGSSYDSTSCVVVRYCGNFGSITSTYASVFGYVGGVVGRIHATKGESHSLLSSCYNQGAVAAAGCMVGGISGSLHNPSSGNYLLTVDSCYNTGMISTSHEKQEVGALFGGTYLYGEGNKAGLVISNCYYASGTAAVALPSTVYAGSYPTAGTYTWEDMGNAAKSAASMKTSDFVAQLGDPYVAGDPYPVIGPPCLVSFRTQPQSASYSLMTPFSVAPLWVEVDRQQGSDALFQWFSVSSDGETMTEIPGATSSAYQPDLPKDGKGEYQCGSWRYCCVVVDSQGVAVVSQIATVTVWNGVTAQAPVFTKDLENTTALQGDEVLLQVEAEVGDGGVVTYQWYRLDEEEQPQAIKGATGQTLEVDTLNLGSACYYCVATNTSQTEENTAQTRSAACVVTIRPYTISTPQQLRAFSDEVNSGKTFDGLTIVLDNDIDLSHEAFIPVGNQDNPFMGIFDGQGHRITGLSLSGGSSVALFGATKGSSSWEKDHAVVKNLQVYGEVNATGTRVAAIVAAAGWTTLENVGSYVNVSSASTSATSYVAGLIGVCESASVITVSGCFSAGDISSKGGRVGGLVGDASNSELSVCDCFVAGKVSGSTQVGGLVGTTTFASGWLRGIVFNSCYVSGVVEGTSVVGGLMGLAPVYYNQSAVTVNNCVLRQGVSSASFGSATGVTGEARVMDSYGLRRAADVIGEAFVLDGYDLHDGYPALAWERDSKPFVSEQPQEVSCFQGTEGAALSIEACPYVTGDALSYQWYRSSSLENKGVPVDGATGALLLQVDTSEQGTFYYSCLVIEGGAAQTWSLPARVVIMQPAKEPMVNSVSPDEVQATQGLAGSSVVLDAKSVDGGQLSYQWYRAQSIDSEGDAIPGETSSSISDFGTQLGTYYLYCVVTNTLASADNSASVRTERVKVTVRPLEIATAQDYLGFAAAVNSGTTFEGCQVRLVESLDLRSTASVVPVGNQDFSFLGTFDGCGNTIRVALSGKNYTALFGHAGDASTQCVIENLLVDGVVSGSGNDTAAVVGWGQNVLLRNVGNYAKVTVTGYGYGAAGLVGGAPTGSQAFITLENCFNAGSIMSAGYDAAGLVGDVRNNVSTITITDCYNTGSAKAASFAGGLYGGDDYYKPTVLFARCYNAGTIQKSGSYGYVGALCGYVPVGTGKALSADCFYLDTSCSVAGGSGALDASSVAVDDLMALPASLNRTGAFHKATPKVPNDGYPVLVWQVDPETPGTLGDINNNGRLNIVDAQVIYDLSRNIDALWDSVLAKYPEGATRESIQWIADVNEDGCIDAADAFAVQYLVHHAK